MTEHDDDPYTEDEEPRWEQGNHAAAALQAYLDERQGVQPGLGEGYGDEGSDEFVDAIENLLVDLRHLAYRAGVSFPEIDERASERWMAEIDDDEKDDEPQGMSRIEEEHDYKFGEWRL